MNRDLLPKNNRTTRIIDSSDEMMVDGPSGPPSENAMTNGGAGSEMIESEEENWSESENDKVAIAS